MFFLIMYKILFIFVILFNCFINQIYSLKSDNNELIERHKRTLIFPFNGAMGIIAAIAVPLNLPKRNVFMSYNFEANYNSPIYATDFSKGVLTRLDIQRSEGRMTDEISQTKVKEKNETIIDNANQERSFVKRFALDNLLSRKNVYNIIENKMVVEGFKGRACLLRAICETAEHPLNEHNGVLGDIFQIILTPSLSMEENIHGEYYNAEQQGLIGKCNKYKKYCPENILNLISKIT